MAMLMSSNYRGSHTIGWLEWIHFASGQIVPVDVVKLRNLLLLCIGECDEIWILAGGRECLHNKMIQTISITLEMNYNSCRALTPLLLHATCVRLPQYFLPMAQ